MSELRELTRHISLPEGPEGYRKMQGLLAEMGLDSGHFYQELEMSSRYVDTHRDISWITTRVQLHSHTFYELLYCRNTCGVEYLVGADRYRLQRGDIIWIPPGVSHRPLLPEVLPEPYKRYVLWVSPEFVEIMKRQFPDVDGHRQVHTNLIRTAGTRWEFLGEYFRRGVEESENALPGWQAVVAGNTVTLLVQMQRAMDDSGVKPLPTEKPELLDRVMHYVERNLDKRITLAETARQFYVSESTISQLFRKKMDVSFYRCVNQRRLIAAKTLIWENVPMEEVSRRVGFADYSSFYRAFKQEYGISPRQYRKRRESASQE